MTCEVAIDLSIEYGLYSYTHCIYTWHHESFGSVCVCCRPGLGFLPNLHALCVVFVLVSSSIVYFVIMRVGLSLLGTSYTALKYEIYWRISGAG